jgi:hypothetical protein
MQQQHLMHRSRSCPQIAPARSVKRESIRLRAKPVRRASTMGWGDGGVTILWNLTVSVTHFAGRYAKRACAIAAKKKTSSTRWRPARCGVLSLLAFTGTKVQILTQNALVGGRILDFVGNYTFMVRGLELIEGLCFS